MSDIPDLPEDFDAIEKLVITIRGHGLKVGDQIEWKHAEDGSKDLLRVTHVLDTDRFKCARYQ